MSTFLIVLFLLNADIDYLSPMNIAQIACTQNVKLVVMSYNSLNNHKFSFSTSKKMKKQFASSPLDSCMPVTHNISSLFTGQQFLLFTNTTESQTIFHILNLLII